MQFKHNDSEVKAATYKLISRLTNIIVHNISITK